MKHCILCSKRGNILCNSLPCRYCGLSHYCNRGTLCYLILPVLPPAVQTSTAKPRKAAGSTAKAAGSPRRSSASRAPPTWRPIATACAGPPRGGSPQTRPQARPASTSSESLPCDAPADGCETMESRWRMVEDGGRAGTGLHDLHDLHGLVRAPPPPSRPGKTHTCRVVR